jgi:hypothetical protein
MRPPGYVRPLLPFDSLDRVLGAAGVDLQAWRGVRVLANRADRLTPVEAPEGERPSEERASHHHGEHYPHLVRGVV